MGVREGVGAHLLSLKTLKTLFLLILNIFINDCLYISLGIRDTERVQIRELDVGVY